jgi:hypothetical protein
LIEGGHTQTDTNKTSGFSSYKFGRTLMLVWRGNVNALRVRILLVFPVVGALCKSKDGVCVGTSSTPIDIYHDFYDARANTWNPNRDRMKI